MIDITLDAQTDRVDWGEAKRLLHEDDFDNGRSPAALRRSFENSQHVVYARINGRLVGMARMLSDGICNTYLLDVWTSSLHRRQGIGSRMVRDLLERVPGHHVGLQTDDAKGFSRSLGFQEQPIFMSTIVGTWLDHDQHRVRCRGGRDCVTSHQPSASPAASWQISRSRISPQTSHLP